MAKSLLKTAPRKKTAVRSSKVTDEQYTGPEPKWTSADTWSEDKIRDAWRHGLYYYNYHHTIGDLIKFVRQYGLQRLDWSKQEVAAFNSVEEWRTGMTAAAACKMILSGAPCQKDTADFVATRLSEVLAIGRANLSEQAAAAVGQGTIVKLTIQDRLRDRLSDTIGEIESWYDAYRNGAQLPDMVAWFRNNNIPQQFVNQIADYYAPKMEELLEAKLKTADEQLKEGYQHLNKTAVKQITAFYDTLTGSLETYGAVKKAVRKSRVKKPPSKEKIVKKVKFCAQHTELNLVSVNPVDIIGAQTVWVYNIKTRKLGKYVAAADAGQLAIKGSAIIGFDTKQSVAKTLRKPTEQLKQFSSAGKVALRSYIEDIKAVAVALNGRITADWVLLKTTK